MSARAARDKFRSPRKPPSLVGRSPGKVAYGPQSHPKSSPGDVAGRRSGMTLRQATLLALIATILLTALLAWDLISNILNVVHGLVPAVIVVSSFIYTFASFGVAVFLYVFRRTQA